MAEPGAAARQVLADRLIAERAGEAAALLEHAAATDAAELLAAQPAERAARVVERMVPVQAAEVFAALPDEARATLLPAVSTPRAAAALAWLPSDHREAIVTATDTRTARELRSLLSYPEDTAGEMMDPRVITLREDDRVADALERLRGATRSVYQVYIVDDAHRLIGVVPVQRLATADREAVLGTLMDGNAVSVMAMASREEVVDELQRTGAPALPVVDAEGALVGVLRHRTLVDAAEEEAGADIQRMVGVSSEERALSSVRFKVRQRLPWLNINLITAFLAASVVSIFDSTIAQVTSLAVLLPVVAGQSGNAGAQALAVTMRGLAMREIRPAHWSNVALREVAVGLINGVALALVCGIGVFIWSGSVGLAGVIAVAMVMAMTAAGLAGASVPIVLRLFGQDPAQASSIILTTVTDIVGFFSFLGLATALIDYL